MRLTLAAVLVLLLAAPATAPAADERRLSTDGGGIDAEGGWTIWEQVDEMSPELPIVPQWRQNGRVVRSRAPLGALGTTARGNVVVVDHRCGARRTCSVNQRRPASLDARRLISRTPLQLSDVDEYRGTLAFTVDHRPYVRRRGQTRFERVDSLVGGHVDVGRGFLVYRAEEHGNFVVRMVDFRGHRPRAQTVAVDDMFDEDCRCTQASTSITDLTIEGAYVYWLARTYTSLNDSPVGSGGPYKVTSAMFRVRTRSPGANPEVFRPERPAFEFAVDGARLVYAADGEGDDGTGVFEVPRPDWRPVPPPQT